MTRSWCDVGGRGDGTLLGAACSGGGGTDDGGGASAPPGSSTDPSATAAPVGTRILAAGRVVCMAGVAAPPGCWQKVLPLGSGGFPPSPGSENQPVWEPGKFPLTLRPNVAIDDELWMAAQTVAYSSPDGLTWTEHAKTDWGERIYQTVVSFQDKLWMYGGLDYDTGAFLNDIWVSSDGTTWEQAGTAPWSPRGGHAMVGPPGTAVALRRRRPRRRGPFHGPVPQRRVGVRRRSDVDAGDRELHRGRRVTRRTSCRLRRARCTSSAGRAIADVWTTLDGRQWTQLVSRGPVEVPPRRGPAGVRRQAVGLRRLERRVHQRVERRLVLADGATWEQQAEHAPWAERAPISVVFDDRIWIYSGKHTGADDNWGGDLWQMAAVTNQVS